MWKPVLCVLAFCFLTGSTQHAHAQTLDQTFGGCPERSILDERQRSVIGGLAAIGAPLDSYFSRRANPVIEAQMKSCARDVHTKVCTDKLLGSILGFDGSDAGMMAGGAIISGRSKGQPSVLGGMLTKGLGSTIKGTVEMSVCRKRMENELMPAAQAAFAGWQIHPNRIRHDEVRQTVVDAARRGRITPEQAQSLTSFAEAVTRALAN